MAKISFTAGALVRREARYAGAVYGLQVQEFKGWLYSAFVMTGSDEGVRQMDKWLRAKIARQRTA